MFQELMSDEFFRTILFWLMNHSVGDYDAAIIAYDCGILDVPRFTAYLVLLNELGIIEVDEGVSGEESLRIIFNEDSLLIQSLKNTKNAFEEEFYRNSNACAAYVSLKSDIFENSIIDMNSFIDTLAEGDIDKFINVIQNYKNMEISDDPFIKMAQEELINKLSQIDEMGRLDELVEMLQGNDRNLYI